MNGKKVLTKLIIVFAALNIILLTLNVIKNISSYRLDDTRINNVIYALEQKEIYLDTELPQLFTPKLTGSLNDLIGSSTTVGRYKMVNTFFGSENVIITKSVDEPDSFIHRLGDEALVFHKNSVEYINTGDYNIQNETIAIEEAQKICKAFIKRLGYKKVFSGEYIECHQENNNLEITFYGAYKDCPVFDTYISFELVGDTIRHAKIKVGEITTSENDKIKQAIYPIDLVLFKIDDELEIQKPMYITDVTLGYKVIDERNILLLGAQLIPVYKIQIKGLNTPIYVNAYTNKRIE